MNPEPRPAALVGPAHHDADRCAGGGCGGELGGLSPFFVMATDACGPDNCDESKLTWAFIVTWGGVAVAAVVAVVGLIRGGATRDHDVDLAGRGARAGGRDVRVGFRPGAVRSRWDTASPRFR